MVKEGEKKPKKKGRIASSPNAELEAHRLVKAGNFDFYLMTIHTDPDDVDVEISAMKVAYEEFIIF